jgi:hypothetical protein
MKLTGNEIARIVGKLLEEWKGENLVTLHVPEGELRDRLVAIFTKDLSAEDDLNREIETLLAKYESEFEKGTLDRRKMFQLVKAQLVKERKLVL